MKSKNQSIYFQKFHRVTQVLEDPCPDSPVVQCFKPNSKGSDYVVGDIHNQWNKLETQLMAINFNPDRDRLFSVGDLIDRGNDNNFKLLDYLNKDWFYAVRGNHEDLILTLLSLPEKNFYSIYADAMNNGANWIIKAYPKLNSMLTEHARNKAYGLKTFLTYEMLMKNFPKLKELYYNFSKMPYILQAGNFGIIHAEVPTNTSWDELISKVNNLDFQTLSSLTWGRERYTLKNNNTVDGIDTIYCGHTITDKPINLGNHRFIDIGSYQQENKPLHIEKINYDKK